MLSILYLAGILGMAQPAHATLGEHVDSVEADRAVIADVRRSTTNQPKFTIETIESESVQVREYVSSGGVIFGLAWSGMTHPDLSRLLGSYYDEYDSANKKTPRKHGRRHHSVKGSHVIVEKHGHMRKLEGRAYVPELLPSGVSADDIK